MRLFWGTRGSLAVEPCKKHLPGLARACKVSRALRPNPKALKAYSGLEGSEAHSLQDLQTQTEALFMMTAPRPCNVVQWFEQVPQLLSEHGWRSAVRGCSKGSSLTYCECPWGGQLVRFSFKGVPMHVEDPSKSMVRPETRQLELQTPLGFDVLEQLAPGDAVIQHRASWSTLRLSVTLRLTEHTLHFLGIP